MTYEPTSLLERWRSLTATAGLRIALADGDDPRVRTAASELGEYGIEPLLISGTTDGVPGGVGVVEIGRAHV